jgi:endonuclease III
LTQYTLKLPGGPDLAEIRARLLAIWGPQRDAERYDPISQLVYGILSARTYDEVATTAFNRLQHRYRPWRRLCWAPYRDIEPLIRLVTFAERKADYVPHALRSVVQLRGALDLGFLLHFNEEKGMHWLRQLRGVDVKVAATVLNFSTLRRRVLPADTHLIRVGERLGFLPRGSDYRRGYEGYMRLVPDDWDADALYEFHWLVKYFGQTVCTKRSPGCGGCPLRDMCAMMN